MNGAQFRYYRSPNYLTWLRAEASLIGTDGCSGVTGVKVECCYEHDLGFYYGTDPHEAYRLHRSERIGLGNPAYWQKATPITFEEANRRFRKCLQARSALGRYSPMALWRWLGVMVLPESQRAWAAHRKRDQQHKAGV